MCKWLQRTKLSADVCGGRIHEDEHITLIDFPQMVSISHRNAQMYFDRDVDCISTFFERRFGFVSTEPKPEWEEVISKRRGTLDVESAASGFIKKEELLLSYIHIGLQQQNTTNRKN